MHFVFPFKNVNSKIEVTTWQKLIENAKFKRISEGGGNLDLP